MNGYIRLITSDPKSFKVKVTGEDWAKLENKGEFLPVKKGCSVKIFRRDDFAYDAQLYVVNDMVDDTDKGKLMCRMFFKDHKYSEVGRIIRHGQYVWLDRNQEKMVVTRVVDDPDLLRDGDGDLIYVSEEYVKAYFLVISDDALAMLPAKELLIRCKRVWSGHPNWSCNQIASCVIENYKRGEA